MRKHLCIHLIGGDVVRITLKKRPKVRVSSFQFALPEAIEGDAITREGVVRVLGEEFFELLATEFALFSHGGISYYTWRMWLADKVELLF